MSNTIIIDTPDTPEPETPKGQLSDAVIARIEQRLIKETGFSQLQVRRTIELLGEGATIPFIARYRKEMTGNLDEVQLASLSDRYDSLVTLEHRRAFIAGTIDKLGKLTLDLAKHIDRADTLSALEDLYLPYKPRRRTRAQKARELGLEPLADAILKGDLTALTTAALGVYLKEGVADAQAALSLARDIIAERISESAPIRDLLRDQFANTGRVAVTKGKTEDPEGKFTSLLNLKDPIKGLQGHRILALNRAENEGVIRFTINADTAPVSNEAHRLFAAKLPPACAEHVRLAIQDSLERLLSPSIETETRQSLTDFADEEAIAVFADNLRNLLMAPPLGGHAVIGVDPGFRTGCKVAVIDPRGDLVTHFNIYPHPPQNQHAQATEQLIACVKHFAAEFTIGHIAYGNGTASRETAKFLAQVIANLKKQGYSVEAVQVSESGASVYSASAIAREEFPDLDLTVRGAISIARRLQDPLAELIKTDPKSIGVGQYQHDVNQKKLAQALDRVVESCVNQVGVDLNTASAPLLIHVSGLNPKLAKAILKHRTKLGGFTNRKQLLEVAGLGPKTFELCAGFLRIRDGDNVLDNTAVHPERYDLVGRMCRESKLSLPELVANPKLVDRIEVKNFVDEKAGVGLPTLTDIITELKKPGRDPRGHFEVFAYAEGVSEVADLKPDMELPGIVTNVTKFGAFVDVGVHQDGLVHISELSTKFIRDPSEAVSVGQKVRVKVLQVEPSRNRIALSIKQVAQ